MVSCGVKPWFDAFVGTREGAGKDAGGEGGGGEAKLEILMTKKKFVELELSLLRLQQHVEISERKLVVYTSFDGLLSWYTIFFLPMASH